MYQRKCSSCFETSDVTKLGTQMNRELREEIGEGGKYVIVLDWLKPQTKHVCNLAKKLNMLLECQMHFVLNVFFHSSQFQSLCLTKSSNETLQNLPYFIYTKTQSCFFRFSFRATLYFSLMNTLVYVDIDQGIH